MKTDLLRQRIAHYIGRALNGYEFMALSRYAKNNPTGFNTVHWFGKAIKQSPINSMAEVDPFIAKLTKTIENESIVAQ